jgi:hypothetical protein
LDKYIVPPRLNRKQLVFGFTVWEGFSIVATLVLTFFTQQPVFLPVAAVIVVFSYRPPGKELNVKSYVKLLFTYYKSMQVYSLRECEPRENK